MYIVIDKISIICGCWSDGADRDSISSHYGLSVATQEPWMSTWPCQVYFSKTKTDE